MSLEETLCPDCGAKMISRTGKFGAFWGCSAYPKCKGTRDSQGRSKADREEWKEEQLEKSNNDELTPKERDKKNKKWTVE